MTARMVSVFDSRCAALDLDAIDGTGPQRHIGRPGGKGDAGHAGHAVPHILVEGLSLGSGVARLAGIRREDGEMGGLEAGVHFVRAADAPQEQCGGHQQEKRECHLADQERMAEADRAAVSSQGAAGFLERLGEAGAGGTERRGGAE